MAQRDARTQRDISPSSRTVADVADSTAACSSIPAPTSVSVAARRAARVDSWVANSNAAAPQSGWMKRTRSAPMLRTPSDRAGRRASSVRSTWDSASSRIARGRSAAAATVTARRALSSSSSTQAPKPAASSGPSGIGAGSGTRPSSSSSESLDDEETIADGFPPVARHMSASTATAGDFPVRLLNSSADCASVKGSSRCEGSSNCNGDVKPSSWSRQATAKVVTTFSPGSSTAAAMAWATRIWEAGHSSNTTKTGASLTSAEARIADWAACRSWSDSIEPAGIELEEPLPRVGRNSTRRHGQGHSGESHAWPAVSSRR